MGDALTTYLQDHLAGALHAIELLKAMRDHHAGEPLGQFAAQLLVEIEADRNVLAGLIEGTGTAPGGVKEWGAWLAEKVSRLKLKHGSAEGLGTEMGSLAALSVVAGDDSRLQGTDFNKLTTRAESQHASVDERRLACARSALGRDAE
jgi:hypothetical protein